ncbi:WD repeat-containing protein 19, partial [Quaeritorhiza haematococci]
CGIQALYPNPQGGTKIIFRDSQNDGWMLNPAQSPEFIMKISNMSAKTQGILWDVDSDANMAMVVPGTMLNRFQLSQRQQNRGAKANTNNSNNRRRTGALFVSWDNVFLTTHVHHPFTIKGPQVLALGTTKMPYGLVPVCLIGGVVSCLTPSGKLTQINLTTNEHPTDIHRLFNPLVVPSILNTGSSTTTTKQQKANSSAVGGLVTGGDGGGKGPTMIMSGGAGGVVVSTTGRGDGGAGAGAGKDDALLAELAKWSEQDQGKMLQILYMLGRWEDLWSLIPILPTKKPWIMLAEAALHVLDLHTARRVYRQVLNNAGMVMTLDDIIERSEDKNVAAGHVAAILGNIPVAQEYFLNSSEPVAALELRRNLMHWDQALSLAQSLAPEQVTIIAKEYAQQLEFDGKYSDAFAMYEKALSTLAAFPLSDDPHDFAHNEGAMIEHQIATSAGLTRMTLRMGDISRGMKMLMAADEDFQSGGDDENDPQMVQHRKLLLDCAGILESLKQYSEAGSLYERVKNWDKAAEVYMKGKNISKAASVMSKVVSPKIHLQHARIKEAEKQFDEAARAYEKGRDLDSVVRLYVENLQNISGDYKSVVEFCLMAGMTEEAFEIATQHDEMEHFAELIKDEASTEMLLNISAYFESKRQYVLAGKYLLQCGEYHRALQILLQTPIPKNGAAADATTIANANAAIDMAIETVGLAKNDVLTHELIDYLMGERDGVPKDAKYIFKLYMSLKQYKEAARTAIIIAREEQMLGNYRAAHDLLLENFIQLRKTRAKIPSELQRMLMLLHSYILVKTLIRIDNHEKSARMLIRVANHISKFPSHVIPILTSTVIECQRAGLKRSAFEYAAMLMRPEYRAKVDPKYKRKIEQIVRRPADKDEVEEEPKTPCPYCSNMVPETVLDCLDCKNHMPYCIATGRHMILDDWCECPTCKFPALHSQFKDLISKTKQCPMCSAELSVEQLVLLPNVQARERLKGDLGNKEPQEREEEKSTPRPSKGAQGAAESKTAPGPKPNAAGTPNRGLSVVDGSKGL